METSLMETDEVVIENPVEPENKLDEIAPVEVSETRAQPPEIKKSPVQQVNMFDVTKLSYELQQGYRVFIEMSGDSYKNVSWPFMEPVDAEALGLWDYHEKIKKPMSFNEIGCKFNNYEYSSITEVVSDIRLILENCYRYNGSNHWVSKLGHKMEKILEQKLALLNRSLRDKVSLEATMALRSDFISVTTPAEGTGRRRTAPRNSYVKMINGEDSSSLLTRLKIQEDIEERERRRIREKEKKEANLVLLQDLAEWEEKELGTDVVKELHSMWEIPSLAGFLFLLKDFLYIQDLSITELELGFVYANKSSLLARIFTALLITPHQRKSLFKKPPMKFIVWESKLRDRVSSWYKATEKDGQELTCHQYGLDMALFEVLGEVNPLLEKSYMDLTLHQRVWILKCLCDNSLVRDYDFRDHLGTIAPTDQRELYLGSDANNWSYLYFPIFSSTDLRIYKQCPLDVPTLSKRKKKVTPPPPPPPPPAKVKPKVTPARDATPTPSRQNTRLRRLRNSTPLPEPETPPPPLSPPPTEPKDPPEPKNTIPEGFELTAYDIETLKKLCEKFDEPSPPPKKRGRKPKPPPPRKRCEVELHQTLLALLEELEKYEMSFSKLLSKAKIKIMKESQEPEPEDEPEEVIPAGEGEEWGSEESIGDEIEDAGAQNMSSDEDFILDDEEGRKSQTPTPSEATKDGENSENKGNTGMQIVLPQKRKAAEEGNVVEESTQHSASAHVDTDNDPCSISIQTAPLKLKKKRKKSTATPVPQLSSLGITQANQQLSSHVPSGLQVVKEIRPANVATINNAASVNKNVASGSCINTAGTGGVFTVRSPPSTNITQTNKTMTSVRIHPKPVILNKSSAATKHSSSNAVPKSNVQTITSAHAVTVSRNLSSTSSSSGSSFQSQAGLSAAIPGVGKVMFVTSSGVPLQVLKAVPVSQQGQGKTLNTAVLGSTGSPASVCVVSSSSSLSTPTGVSVPLQVLKAVPVSQKPLVQGKTVNTAAFGSDSKSSPVCSVSSSSSLSTPTGVSVLASSSLHAKSTQGASQLPSSPVHKVVTSATPNKLANILSTSKQTSHVGTTSASPLNPRVIFVQRPGAGGVVPVAIKGGAMVMSAPSASQQVVVIRPSSTLASSTTTSTTTLLSGTGISVLGNTQIAQTALGQKMVLAPTILKAGQNLPLLEAKTASVVTSNKPLVQVPMSPIGMKPSEAKTESIALGSKPVVTTTMTTASASPAKAPTTTVSLAPSVLPTGNSLPQMEANTTCSSVVTDNKPLVQVPMGMKPTEPKTTAVALGNKTVVATTALPALSKSSPPFVTVGNTTSPVELKFTSTASPTVNKQVPLGTTTSSPALNKTPSTTVTVGSNSTVLIITPVESKSTCAASPACNQQVALGSNTSADVTAPNEQSSKVESPCVCSTEVSHAITRTVASNCNTVKVTDIQTVSALSPHTDFKQNDQKCEDSLLSSKTIPLGPNCEPGKLAGICMENKDSTDGNKNEKDAKNSFEQLLDLTCYETSVSDSAGCDESDDSGPNGLHPDTKTTLPSKLIETDVELCNGVPSPLTQDKKCEEKELGSGEQNHAAMADRTSNGVTISKTK